MSYAVSSYSNYVKIRDKIEELKANIFSDVQTINKLLTSEGIKVKQVPYNSRNTVLEDSLKWESFGLGGTWGGSDTHYCFQLQITVPEIYRGKEVLFFLSTGAEDIWNTNNPQMLIYIDGKMRCGMDMNHNSVIIFEKEDWDKRNDRVVDIRIYAYSNLGPNENHLKMTVAARNENVQTRYFDFKVPFEAMQAMLGIPASKRETVLGTTAGAFEEQNTVVEISQKIFDSLTADKNAFFILDELTKACEADDPSQYLRDNLYGIKEPPAIVSSVGHTHIDVAWKWQIRQTKEKVLRSYSTVLELMKRYPEYIFMASTPQMYEFVRKEEPELFEKIKEKVKEGKFEPEGAMWLEADCNLTSGESLVRQILYGKEYFKENFEVDSHILWLPDVFGYSAALPQILKKSGIKAFMTTKIAWNDTNRLPHDLFIWQGIDGSRIPTYLITTCDVDKAKEAGKSGGTLNYTYNGKQNASQIMGTWKAFREKDITNDVLTCYGYGDGGGGPTWEMLETDRRLFMGIPGVPKTEKTKVTDFFDKLLENIDNNQNVPIWDDELYLEYHRGTFTSIGKNKRNNRRSEYLMMETELLSVWGNLLCGNEYPRSEIKAIWKKIMLNQFHDILPGSSIEEVYIDSDKDYQEITDTAVGLIENALDNLSNEATFKNMEAAVFAKDYNSSKKIECVVEKNEIKISTVFYNIIFDENAEIVSLYDKENRYELRPKDACPLNRLIAFQDKPMEYDCWNIDANFEEVFWNITKVKNLELKTCDNEVTIMVERMFENSKIIQLIRMYRDNRRIDFETKADWHEHQTLLKAAFPVNVESDNITCEIQYGNIKRSLKKQTSWEKAKFECCAHKWIDISDEKRGYGVAILNDCKYGYDAKEKLMRLTLIKSGIFPNPNADQGIHEFTYSLLSHTGNYREGMVIEEARLLNENKHFHLLENRNLSVALLKALAENIIDYEESGIFVDGIKLSEKSDAVIVRLYEGYGKKHNIKAKLFGKVDIKPEDIKECDLLENDLEESKIYYDKVKKEVGFTVEPFEIKTFKIITKACE